MAEDPGTAWTDVYCLRPYNPYRIQGELNPAFSRATDGRVLDLKENQDSGVASAVADFREGLGQLGLPRGTILVVVPGHEARQSNAGCSLARVAVQLGAEDDRYIPRVDSLLRSSTVAKKSQGGARDPNIEHGTVVILDDVVSSGGSMTAARQLVTRAGARSVAAVALGRTVRYF